MNHSARETPASFEEEFSPPMTGGLFSRIKLQMQTHSCTLNERCRLSSLSEELAAGVRTLKDAHPAQRDQELSQFGSL